jgi:hypothetical protein
MLHMFHPPLTLIGAQTCEAPKGSALLYTYKPSQNQTPDFYV